VKPDKLGPYRIDDELGRGGMGVVYRATHESTGRVVAIKVLPPELALDAGFAERFAREVTALQKLSHPNIVQFIEAGEENKAQFYVMEFVPGRGLDKVIREQRRIPWEPAVDLAIQICHGLRHAHAHGIIHRDLKPANLLLTEDGTIKLTDFGIAKVFAGTAITATGGIVGTAEYMSPEQGEGKPITLRSDLYSLGVVLYMMLTGRVPFLGRSVAELINLHRFGQFEKPMMVVPEIPSWLDALVCQLLEKDPEKRPADAHVVVRRLESVQKKVALRSALTVATGDGTVAEDATQDMPRGGIGPATLMQRLMRAQLRELAEPGLLGRIFQHTGVIAISLLVSVLLLAAFAMTGGERRRWKEIERLLAAGDDRNAALLVDRLNNYLQRYPASSHAAAAREHLPEAERDRRRREFARSPVVDHLRPSHEAVPELERLYRKALLQLWAEGEDTARATLEQIAARRDSAGTDIYVVDLAEADLLSLDLQRAASLHATGQTAEARTIWQRIVEEYSSTGRQGSAVSTSRQWLAKTSDRSE
jgi:serine/threonine-protein kinase